MAKTTRALRFTPETRLRIAVASWEASGITLVQRDPAFGFLNCDDPDIDTAVDNLESQRFIERHGLFDVAHVEAEFALS